MEDQFEPEEYTPSQENYSFNPSAIKHAYWIRSTKLGHQKLFGFNNGKHYLTALDNSHVTARHQNIVDDKTGKWMLFLDKKEVDNEGLTQLDRTWHAIQELHNISNVQELMCSTGAQGTTAENHKTAVIYCITRHYHNILDIKSIADAIRNIVQYDGYMYYKSSIASLLGQCRATGYNGTSMYRHDSNCNFYINDNRVWVLYEPRSLPYSNEALINNYYTNQFRGVNNSFSNQNKNHDFFHYGPRNLRFMYNNQLMPTRMPRQFR